VAADDTVVALPGRPCPWLSLAPASVEPEASRVGDGDSVGWAGRINIDCRGRQHRPLERRRGCVHTAVDVVVRGLSQLESELEPIRLVNPR
jgi:hypothetical protein